MIKSVGLFVLSIIIALLLALGIALYQKNELGAALKQATSTLNNEKSKVADLHAYLEDSEQSNLNLIEQLESEREAVKAYQLKNDALMFELKNSLEQIRILEREDEKYRAWANTALPFGLIGLLNQAN